MTRDLASLKNLEQFTKLFQLASKELDQDKVGALFEEILGLLESQTVQLDRTNTVASASI
jgi:hypothetical protein